MRIRVFEVLASLGRAGAENMALTLSHGLDRRRFDLALISLYDSSSNDWRPGVPTWTLGKRRGFDPRMWPRLAHRFRIERPHLLHTHSYVLRYVWPAALLAGGIPIVHTVHNQAEKEVDRLGRLLHRIAFRRGVTPVAISAEIAHSFRRLYGFDVTATILNGIELSPFRAAASERNRWRSTHGFLEEDFLIVSVARLDPQKNPLALIQAFQRALGGQPHCHLLLAGRGSLEAGARALAESLGLGRRIHFLGLRQDIPALLAASDLFVLASSWEGCPLAVMEALASGLPVIATAVGGVPELIENGRTGLLVPPADVPALAAALSSLVGDPSSRAAMREAAISSASRFSEERMIRSYAALFERVLEKAA